MPIIKVAILFKALIIYGHQKVKKNLNPVKTALYIEIEIAAVYFEANFYITINEGIQIL